jgi:hypothetical protein
MRRKERASKGVSGRFSAAGQSGVRQLDGIYWQNAALV